MPYINNYRREKFKNFTDHMIEIIKEHDPSSGDMNYLMCTFLREFIDLKGETYDRYNTVMGIISGVDKEFYRRKIAKYEDGAIGRNSDIF